MEGKYLITTDAWFYAPDGLKYRSVWGGVRIIEDSVLGLKILNNKIPTRCGELTPVEKTSLDGSMKQEIKTMYRNT